MVPVGLTRIHLLGRIVDLFVRLYWNLRPRAWMERAVSGDKWDEIELTFLSRLIDPSRGAIDVGAHWGKYTFRLARIAPIVHALEPDRELAARLKRVAPANVQIHCVAASRRAGTAELTAPVIGGRKRVSLGSLEPVWKATDKMGVQTTRTRLVALDALVNGPIGFIKIDVEGHEIAVLEGAARILRHDKPTVLVEVEERHKPGSIAAVRRLMERFGYSGFFIFRARLRSIDDFTYDMQNLSELSRNARRLDMNYVNNFIYIHESRKGDWPEILEMAQ